MLCWESVSGVILGPPLLVKSVISPFITLCREKLAATDEMVTYSP